MKKGAKTKKEHDDDPGMCARHQSSPEELEHLAVAAADCFTGPISPAIAARPGHPTSAVAVRKNAGQFFRQSDPVSPQGRAQLLRRELPHVYPPAVIGQLPWHLADAVTNGGRLFLQGDVSGVGTSMFVCDYANAFNRAAKEGAYSGRIRYIRIERGATSPAKFFDALGIALKAPLTTVELRFRSSVHLASRVLSAAAQSNAVALVFDHVRWLPPEVRGMIGLLCRATDPAYHVDDEPSEYDEYARRVAVILVDHVDPATLFLTSDDVLMALGGRVVVMPRYKNEAITASAIMRADVGLADLNEREPDDAAMIALLHEKSAGLVSQLAPILGTVDMLRRINDRRRPDPELVAAAIPFHRQLIELDLAKGRNGGDWPVLRVAAPANPSQRDPYISRGRGSRKKNGAARTAYRVASQAAAEKERRKMIKKSNVNLGLPSAQA